MEYQAKELVCRECAEWFVFTAKERRFYTEQGFPPPKRCPTCRAERRRQEQVRERFDITQYYPGLTVVELLLFGIISSDRVLAL